MIQSPPGRKLKFTKADVDRAGEEWGCNCGPAALAALLGLTLEKARGHIGGFPGYMNPTMMKAALLNAGARVAGQRRDGDPPDFGLVFVQWTGPWTKTGVHPRAAYQYTHWIASADGLFFDINAMDRGGWLDPKTWEVEVASELIADIDRADGMYPRLLIDVEGL